MSKIIFLKKLDDCNEICKYKKLIFINKLICIIRCFFNLIIKKKINSFNIWILPFTDKVFYKKVEKIIKREIRRKNLDSNTRFVLERNLKNKELLFILDKYGIKYINGNLAKKILIPKLLTYINNLQNKKQNEREITILVNHTNKTNIDLITKLAFDYKSIKIVSKQINRFKALEEKLYNENGIAIQFSNSYKKSLKDSEIIINLDFNEIEINEYNINLKAIIINTEEKIKIKSRTFNGIVIDSYKIKFKNNLKEFINSNKDFDTFEKLDIYETLLYDPSSYNLNENEIKIYKVIGYNGIISEKEFKENLRIYSKSIDKI